MNILFDSQIFDLQKYGGISRYYAELISRIRRRNDIQATIAVKESANIYYRQVVMEGKYIPWFHSGVHAIKEKLFPGKRALENFQNSVSYLKSGKYAVFHPTYFDPYYLELVKSPVVATVYDLIYELFPNYFDSNEDEIIRANKKKCITSAAHIIAISENTKRDIMIHYGISEKNITVIHLGAPKRTNSTSASYSVPFRKYILFVGNRGLYKNFSVVVQAITKLLQNDPSLYLFCIGSPLLQKEKQMLIEYGIKDQVIQREVNEETLQKVYSEALCFVFPSLYEGFGLPILEAYQAGCPVICSNTSSFPEVAGEAAIYFNPDDANELRNALNEVLMNTALRNDMILKGYQRATEFSWEKMTAETIAVYKKVIGL